jgi:hypothetical protein
MASPLLGIAGVNSLLFAFYGISKRIISLYPLSLKGVAVARAMAGAANAILGSCFTGLCCIPDGRNTWERLKFTTESS